MDSTKQRMSVSAAMLARQAQRIAQDEDVQQRAAEAGLRLMRKEGTFQDDLTDLARQIAAAYERDQRRSRRRSWMRAAVLLTLLGAGAYAGTRASRG
jgi:hypothetical protein